MEVGKIAKTPVEIVRDDEFQDRFFLVVSAPEGSMHWTISDTLLHDFQTALVQANEGLNR